jgi:hypothetical protein
VCTKALGSISSNAKKKSKCRFIDMESYLQTLIFKNILLQAKMAPPAKLPSAISGHIQKHNFMPQPRWVGKCQWCRFLRTVHCRYSEQPVCPRETETSCPATSSIIGSNKVDPLKSFYSNINSGWRNQIITKYTQQKTELVIFMAQIGHCCLDHPDNFQELKDLLWYNYVLTLDLL